MSQLKNCVSYGSSLSEAVYLVDQEGKWAPCGYHSVYHILLGGLCRFKLYFFLFIHIFEVVFLKVKSWHIVEDFIEVLVSFSSLRFSSSSLFQL